MLRTKFPQFPELLTSLYFSPSTFLAITRRCIPLAPSPIIINLAA